jgi:hypothetical protein
LHEWRAAKAITIAVKQRQARSANRDTMKNESDRDEIAIHRFSKTKRINGTGSVPFGHVNLITAQLLFTDKICTAIVSCWNLPVFFAQKMEENLCHKINFREWYLPFSPL